MQLMTSHYSTTLPWHDPTFHVIYNLNFKLPGKFLFFLYLSIEQNIEKLNLEDSNFSLTTSALVFW